MIGHLSVWYVYLVCGIRCGAMKCCSTRIARFYVAIHAHEGDRT